MKKVLLFSLLLSGASLNANHVTPELPKNVDQAALTTLVELVEKGKISHEELELLVGKDQANVVFATIILGSAFVGAAIYGAVVVGLAFASRNDSKSNSESHDASMDHFGL